MFGLVDCNNFYVSCERVFQPKLINKPVVVLSNNDGCVISRSNEAKALGIKMGEPFFKVRDLIKKHKVFVRSSNYALYGDMSCRVMQILEGLVPEVDRYSIDEAFLNLTHIKELESFAQKIRLTVLKWTGIPVSIGIGPSKTLSKVANYFAKRVQDNQGVCLLTDFQSQTRALSLMDVQEVWGIGRRLAKTLKSHQINTALDLRGTDPKWVLKKMTITGLRTVIELRGKPCNMLQLEAKPNKQIIRSRSFGRSVTELTELEEAVATHVSRGAEKLREQELVANMLSVFISTSYFKEEKLQYSNSIIVKLLFATNDTTVLIKEGIKGLRNIYQNGFEYKKAGIVLMDLASSKCIQESIFVKEDAERSKKLCQVLDQLNAKYGSMTVCHGAIGLEREWEMQRVYKSPCYTTNWKELVVARS